MPEKGCDIVHILRFKKKPSALKQKLFALLTVFLLWPAHYATSQTVAAGPQHVLLVTSDGKVWSWGYAGSGRLGNDAVSGVFSPAPIAGLTDVIRVAAGREHSVALRRDGTVWIWGDNSRGQLGNGGGAGTAVPVKVADLAGISAIAAGDDHTLAWSVDGSVWAWGANDLGQLGTGTSADGTRPARVSELHGVLSIGAGARHSLAALIDGSVWAWGDNRRGQLGTADIVSNSRPIRVNGLPQVSILAGGEAHSLALAADGMVWSWGGTTPDEAIPWRISGLPFIMAIAAGGHHDLALSTDGHLWAWGANNFGQLGDGTRRTASRPVMLTTPFGVVSFAAGKTFSVGVSRDGRVWGWGNSAHGQLGEVTTSPRLSAGALGPSPVAPAAQTVATPTFSPVAGNYSSNQNVTITCSTSGASIYFTTNGGDPSETSNPYLGPVPVNQSLTLKARAFKSGLNQSNIATGLYTLKPATPVFTPAPGSYGTAQSVTITTTTSGAEIRVTTDLSDPTVSSPLYTGAISVARPITLKARAFKSGWTNSDLATGSYTITTAATASDLAAGQNASVVLKPEGTVWSWGLGSNGQMGNGSTSDSALAIQATITGVKAIAAGSSHTVALKTDGTVWAWGANSYGQLGNGNTNLQTSPVRVGTLASIITVAAGDFFCVALSSTGAVWTWGRNDAGQLGDGTTAAFKSSPVNAKNFSGANAIAAGNRHVLARKTDGSLWSWGANASGQLGNGNQTNKNTPVAVAGIASVVAIAAGSDHSLATKTDGTTWAWGSNAQGQLGDGTFNGPRLTPGQVPSLVGIVQMAAGDNHSLAVSNDGHAWTWGSNNGGQMGTGVVGGNQPVPLLLSPNPVAKVDGGTAYSLAITDDGTVWSWGNDLTSYKARVPTGVSDPAFFWRAAPATFDHQAGPYQTTFNVMLTTATPGVAIYYTVDGSVPTQNPPSPSVPNPGTVPVNQSLTLKARVFKTGYAPSIVTSAAYELQVGLPTIIPPNGTILFQPTTVQFTCAAQGSSVVPTVYYTTLPRDPIVGTDPSVTCGTANGPLVSSNATVRAIATRPGWTNSSVRTASYTVKVGAPVYSPVAGSYTGAQTVQVTTVTPNAVIRYTTDGTEPGPTSASLVSGGTVSVPQSLVLKSRAYFSDWPPSDRTVGTYVLTLGTVATPTMTPAGGTYSSGQTVTLASSTPGAVIRYTLDGSDPKLFSKAYQYPIPVGSSATLKAKAFKADWTASAITTGAYTINTTTTAAPTLSPRGGPFTIRQTITVTCDTGGAVLHFTTNGADPTEADPQVSGGTVVVDHTQTLKVKAWAQGLESPVTRGDYVITGAIAAANGYTVALKADGTVWSWGDNANGQLGDQSFNQSGVPVQAFGLADAVAVSARQAHTLALDRTGHVWAWGANGSGQLGNGGTANQNSPVQIPDFSGVVAVAAGWSHSLALKADGSVYYWGNDGFNPQRTSPTLLTGLGGVTQIAGGMNVSVALKTDGATSGAVWTWGNLSWLGGARAPFIELTGAAMVTAGNTHVAVAKTDGSIWVWGDNSFSQLGYGTVPSEPSPHHLMNMSSVTAIAGGSLHNLMLASSGVPWAWGYWYFGETGFLTNIPNPHPVDGIDDVVSVTAGSEHSVALRSDGTVWTWGLNSSGQLANGTTTAWPLYYTSVPAPVIGFSVVSNGSLSGDPDGDGLSTEDEFQLGTDPYSADTNGDGIPDGVAIKSGISATNADMDADGLSNAAELAKGTDPFLPDTDGDTMNDAQDCFPLDPTRWQCPPSDPNDHTPPTITLQEPTSATLISVVPPQ